MQRSQVLALSMIAVFALAPGVAVASEHEITGHPGLSVSVADAEFEPGADGTLAVTLLNDGEVTNASLSAPELEQRVTTARAIRAGIDDDGVPITVQTDERAIGALPDGNSAPLEFRLSVDEDAEAGTYTLPLGVTYNYTEAVNTRTEEYNRTSAARTFDVEVTVEEAPAFSVADVDSTLRVGAEGDVTGTVTNTGETNASNVVVVSDMDNRNVEVLETEYAVGDLAAGESAAFSFTAEVSESADAGPRRFPFHVEYRDADGERRTGEDFEARVDVRPSRDTFSVDAEDAAVPRGSETALTVAVTNEGNETLSDVSAKLFADAPISATDSEAFVSGLEPGETAELTFEVAAADGALRKTYPVEMDFQYEGPDGDTKLSDTYRVPVSVIESDENGLPIVLVAAAVTVAALLAVVAYRRF